MPVKFEKFRITESEGGKQVRERGRRGSGRKSKEWTQGKGEDHRGREGRESEEVGVGLGQLEEGKPRDHDRGVEIDLKIYMIEGDKLEFQEVPSILY